MAHMSEHSRFDSPESFWAEADFLARAMQSQWEYFEALGVKRIQAELLPPLPKPEAAAAAVSTKPVPQRRGFTGRTPTEAAARSRKEDSAAEPEIWAPAAGSLEELAQAAGGCQGCLLAKGRKEAPARGKGGRRPLMVFVAKGPEAMEGEAAALLAGMAEKGFLLGPEDYYLTCLVKCRAANAEAPSKSYGACFPILKRELELLSPKIVLAMGEEPARLLSGHEERLALTRHRTYKLDWLNGAFLRSTYCLNDMAASPELKAEAWRELKKMKPGLEKIKQDQKA